MPRAKLLAPVQPLKPSAQSDMSDREIIAAARMHHTASVYQRTMLTNPASIARNRQTCAQLRAIVHMMRLDRKRNACTR